MKPELLQKREQGREMERAGGTGLRNDRLWETREGGLGWRLVGD